MAIEDELRAAIETTRAGRESFLYHQFETPCGTVVFYAQIELSGDTIVCKDVCVYPLSDPPGIKKSTITKALLSELRALLRTGREIGYPKMNVRGERVAGSSSANPGKIANIWHRRKK